MKKPSMTITEVLEDMRGRGLKMSHPKFHKCLEQGVFPFVRVLGEGETGKLTLMIFRKEYEEWASEYLDIST